MGVSSFTAANDLNIGNVTLEAGRFKSPNFRAGMVLVSGEDGVIESAEGLTISSQGILSVRNLKADKLVGDLDADQRTIRFSLFYQLSLLVTQKSFCV